MTQHIQQLTTGEENFYHKLRLGQKGQKHIERKNNYRQRQPMMKPSATDMFFLESFLPHILHNLHSHGSFNGNDPWNF
jgi:hypothetical protein